MTKIEFGGQVIILKTWKTSEDHYAIFSISKFEFDQLGNDMWHLVFLFYFSFFLFFLSLVSASPIRSLLPLSLSYHMPLFSSSSSFFFFFLFSHLMKAHGPTETMLCRHRKATCATCPDSPPQGTVTSSSSPLVPSCG